MSVQNRNLKFLFWVFWKINLCKLTLFFQICPVILKLEKNDRFFQVLDSEKEKRIQTNVVFIIFKMAMKELKTFNLLKITTIL